MMIIAIDGPAGAGKSSIARMAAQHLGYAYIDTGALYRGIGLAVMRQGADTKDKQATADCLPGISLSVRYADDAQRVFLGEEDVSEAIRTPAASMAASDMGANPAVRAYLLELQRSLARAQNSILDGRDIGTVVLPDADIKIFLTAAPEERARRRFEELRTKGSCEPYEKVLAEVIARDEQDRSRPVAPLRPAEDSILLDTTGNEFEQSVQAVIGIIERAIAAKESV